MVAVPPEEWAHLSNEDQGDQLSLLRFTACQGAWVATQTLQALRSVYNGTRKREYIRFEETKLTLSCGSYSTTRHGGRPNQHAKWSFQYERTAHGKVQTH